MRFLWPIFLILIPTSSWAYPEFIGYGYSSCLTCHYNGQGNGPLNDYGRAVWSAEIAGRAFAGNKSDEDLGNSSGFLGSKKLPGWLRPGIKARGINVQTGPGTSDSDSRNILMQADVNAAIHFDKKADKVFVASFGYAPEPYRIQTSSSSTEDVDKWISREHYFRLHQSKKLWMYFGMLDKVYGIRNVNHTAYSRKNVGLGQNDQAHSFIVHFIEANWEFTLDIFAGNLFQDADLRQKGASAMFEYEIVKNWRLGASFLASRNDYVSNERFGLHSKTGLGEGASILFEAGLIRDTPKDLDLKQGYYVYAQAMQRVFRGMHLFFAGQSYKDDIQNGKTDYLIFSSGFVYFPRGRYELRMEAENRRRYSSQNVSADGWNVLTQLHLSF